MIPPRIVAGVRETVDRIYQQAVSGKTLAQGIMRLRGAASNTVLIQYNDSRDLYALELATGAQTLVASVAGGGLLEPRLADKNWNDFTSRRHVSDGFVYVLRETGDLSEELVDPLADLYALMFFDDDMDGTIDNSVGLTRNAWRQAGYRNTNNWLDIE